MKKRLITYFLFLPIILLIAFTPVSSYLPYLAWASVPVSIGLIVYAFIKTKAFYRTKKMILIALMALSAVCMASGVMAQVVLSSPIPLSYQQQQQCQDVKNQLTDLRKVFATVGRIPEAQRTQTQQKEYDDAKKKYEDLMKNCNIQPCPTPKELYEEISADCWACDIANLFIEAGDKVATSVYSEVSRHGYALVLLALGLFFWLITRTYMLVLSFGMGDIGSYFTDLFKKFLLVGGIAILLSFPIRNTVDFVMTPFFLFSATMGQQMQSASERMPSYQSATKIDVQMADKFGSPVQCSYCEDLKNGSNRLPDEKISRAIKYNASLSQRVVSPTMRNALLCTICSVYRVTVPPTVIGQFLFCSAKQIKTDGSLLGKEEVYSDWDSVMVGFFLTSAFFLISALFSFYLIDTFFRICIVLVLFPFLVVAFAFKSTRSYTKKGLDVLIHSMVTYIIIALFMTLTIQIFYTMLGPVSADLVNALADEQNAYTMIKDLVTFRQGDGAWIMLCCVGLVLIVLFILRQLDAYITALTGIGLSNGGGGAAAMAVVGGAMAVKGTVSQVFDEPWKKASNVSGNSPEDKASAIRSWGEDTGEGKAEKGVDKAADGAEKGINAVGNGAADGVDKLGTKAKAAKFTIKVATKVASKASKLAIKYGGRAVVRTAKKLNPVKAIARNKYFNKTVGLGWQAASDTKAAAKYLFGRKK